VVGKEEVEGEGERLVEEDPVGLSA